MKKIKQFRRKHDKINSMLIFKIILILLIPVTSVILYNLNLSPVSSVKNESWMEVVLDVDRFPNGETLVTSTPAVSQTPFIKFSGDVSSISNIHQVYLLDSNNDVKWSINGLGFPHEVDYVSFNNSEYYFIADTDNDDIKQYDSNQNLIWQFKVGLINWTKLDSSWDENSYLMNSIDDDWTHINDVDFINGSLYGLTYDSLLISIRNFNLTILLNYTQEYEEFWNGDKLGNTENIYWWYGTDIIFHQHNPDMMPNGNIVICDSENNRIIEVNQTTKEIIYNITEAGGIKFSWPRDADYNPYHNSFLITDSANNRVIEVNKEGEVLWEWSKDLGLPYEADFLSNGNILVSGGISGIIYEIEYESKNILWSYNANEGTDFFLKFVRYNLSILFVFFIVIFAQNIRKIRFNRNRNFITKKIIWMNSIIQPILIILIIIAIIFTKNIVYNSYYSLLIITQLLR